mgnify:CR=1 FL=1
MEDVRLANLHLTEVQVNEHYRYLLEQWVSWQSDKTTKVVKFEIKNKTIHNLYAKLQESFRQKQIALEVKEKLKKELIEREAIQNYKLGLK